MAGERELSEMPFLMTLTQFINPSPYYWKPLKGPTSYNSQLEIGIPALDWKRRNKVSWQHWVTEDWVADGCDLLGGCLGRHSFLSKNINYMEIRAVDTVTLLKWKQENKVTRKIKECIPIRRLCWLSHRLAVMENKIQERTKEDPDHQPRNYAWHLRRNPAYQEWVWG